MDSKTERFEKIRQLINNNQVKRNRYSFICLPRTVKEFIIVFVGITILFVITSDLHNTRNPPSVAIFNQIGSSFLAPATIASYYILVYAKPLCDQENYLVIKVNYNF